ncbi:MAG TPA: type II and III secretion system protein family protein [Stenotrophobium sp.]|jgi:pilus assembly protein CpaC|nr:type II and III secretion system protein family protein [Stenotrophobium sp.]
MKANPLSSVRFSLLALSLVLVLPVTARAEAQDAAQNIIQVEQGSQRLLRQPHGIARVAVGDPQIADVNVVNRHEVLISGKKLGITSLMVWKTKNGQPVFNRIRVIAAVDPLRTTVKDPELKDAVIDPGQRLEGRLPNLLAYRRAKIAATQGKKGADVVDRSQVELESQVMTQVKISEVSRTTLQQYGLNIGKLGSNGQYGSFTVPGAGAVAGAGGITAALPVQNAFNIVLGDATNKLYSALSLLEQKGLARTLAEPSLLAMSGQTASYLAGGEFPVPVTQGGATAGAITIQYKEFGVRLNISPTILSRDRIAMKVAPEVSDLDFSAGITVGGVSVPSLLVRRTETTVELGDGETFVISGLVSSNLVNNVNKVPWLGDLPVLGAFFKSTSINRQDKELIMIVTPHLVRPLARGAQVPPLPGARYDNYDPSFARTMFLERGNFDTGFSQ